MGACKRFYGILSLPKLVTRGQKVAKFVPITENSSGIVVLNFEAKAA
jgi:hypothetical protein